MLDPDQAVQESTKTVWQRDLKEAHPWWLWGRTYIGLNVIILVPGIVTVVVLWQQTYKSLIEEDITYLDGNALAVKVCTAIIALGNAAITSNWHLDVALLQPYHHLAEYWPGKSSPPKGTPSKLLGSTSALRLDFAGSALFNFTQPGLLTFDVWFMAVANLWTQLTVIIRTATFQNLRLIVAYGLQTSSAAYPYPTYNASDLNIPAGVSPLRIILNVHEGIYLFTAFVSLLIVMVKKRKPFLPRKPYTLPPHILYLCHGTELLEDLDGMSTLPKKSRDSRLERRGQKYALGWMENEAKTGAYIAINRLECISRRFQYPKAEGREIQESRLELSRVEYDQLYPGNKYGVKVRQDAGWPYNPL